MEFRIVEGVYPDYTGFKKDYLSRRYNKKDLMQKYNLTESNYTRLVRDARKEYEAEHGVPFKNLRIGKNSPKLNPKYYYKSRGVYVVTKMIDKRMVYFGQYRSEELAKRVVEICRDHNWRINQKKIRIILDDEGLL